MTAKLSLLCVRSDQIAPEVEAQRSGRFVPFAEAQQNKRDSPLCVRLRFLRAHDHINLIKLFHQAIVGIF